MSPLKKNVNPCRIEVVGMSRYPVFYLTRSELGNIILEKKVLFSPKFVTAMYLLFKDFWTRFPKNSIQVLNICFPRQYTCITLVWLFESQDEVRCNNFRPLKFFLGYGCVLKSPEKIFQERAHTGSGLARCVFDYWTRKNPKIEILKMTVWFVQEF